METKNCNHARRDMEEPRQLPRVHASDKNTLRPLPGRPEGPGLVIREFQFFFYMMKMFEQTVVSELEDSLGEHETAAERNSRDRRANVVRDIICDVIPLKCQFLNLGPRMETKN